MHVVVTGGTGFIGHALVAALLMRGHSVSVPSRSSGKARALLGPKVACADWNGRDPAPLARLLDGADGPTAVVNLAGAGIGTVRWNDAVKAEIRDSRVAATRAVAQAAGMAAAPPRVVVQGSAVGYYGADASARDEIVDESRPRGRGFLAEVCQAWEDAAAPLREQGVRLAVARTGLVLGPGGLLAKFLPPFRWFAGGPLGPGTQWMPWVHLSDEVGAILWMLENEAAQGAYNLCAPMPVTMASFCRTLGRTLKRPSWLPVPTPALKILLGAEMARETVLASQRAVPGRLLGESYGFEVMELSKALALSLQKGL